MKKTKRIKAAALCLVMGTIGLASGLACFPCPLSFTGMLVRGQVDTDGTVALGDFDVAGYTSTAGEHTGTGTSEAGFIDNVFTWQDGTFQILLRATDSVALCTGPFSSEVEVPEYPVPDEIHLVVTHNGCEQTFEITIAAEMVTDYDYPEYDILQLTEPLVIGACPEE